MVVSSRRMSADERTRGEINTLRSFGEALCWGVLSQRLHVCPNGARASPSAKTEQRRAPDCQRLFLTIYTSVAAQSVGCCRWTGPVTPGACIAHFLPTFFFLFRRQHSHGCMYDLGRVRLGCLAASVGFVTASLCFKATCSFVFPSVYGRYVYHSWCFFVNYSVSSCLFFKTVCAPRVLCQLRGRPRNGLLPSVCPPESFRRERERGRLFSCGFSVVCIHPIRCFLFFLPELLSDVASVRSFLSDVT